jgi:hypothetical protein
VNIRAAWIQFMADETGASAASLAIQGEASANPATFTAAVRDASNRPRTATAVAWTPASWNAVGAAGAAQRTADLAALVQEQVNRPGWATGNARPGVLIERAFFTFSQLGEFEPNGPIVDNLVLTVPEPGTLGLVALRGAPRHRPGATPSARRLGRLPTRCPARRALRATVHGLWRSRRNVSTSAWCATGSRRRVRRRRR